MSLLGKRCTMTPSQFRTRLLFKHTTMAMTYDSVPMLIEYMERCHVDFDRTASTLVSVHDWTYHYLVCDAPWNHRNCVLSCYSITMVMPYGVALMAIACMPRYRVGFDCTGSTYTMQHDSTAIACYANALQWQWHIWRWCWFSLKKCIDSVLVLTEQLVRWHLNMSLLGIWCTMLWHDHNCVLACYSTTMAMTYGFALMLIEYMPRYRVGFDCTASTLLFVHVWPWMCNCPVYGIRCNMKHHNCTLACYSNTLQWRCVRRCAGVLIEYMERYCVGFGEQEVRWYWYLFEFECVIYYLVYDALLRDCNCKLTCYWNAIHWRWWHTALRRAYMQRYYVGFEQTARTLVLVDTWIWMCHCLV